MNEIYSSYRNKGPTEEELGLRGLGYSETIVIITSDLAGGEKSLLAKISLSLYATAVSFRLYFALTVRAQRPHVHRIQLRLKCGNTSLSIRKEHRRYWTSRLRRKSVLQWNVLR